MARTFLLLGALNALVSVAAGAFGAHGLRQSVSAELLQVFEVGARYQMYHALGLMVVAWAVTARVPAAALAGWAMLVGIVLFSGSLYALVLTGVRGLGAITPFGGVSFLVGWAALAVGAFRWVIQSS
ncbi:MAG: DUF423 domain-containing protein [Deltaproteobacteria bacterium]|nr:DUF423 domain-containing protein [Deltaproteobacteria bacterium]